MPPKSRATRATPLPPALRCRAHRGHHHSLHFYQIGCGNGRLPLRTVVQKLPVFS